MSTDPVQAEAEGRIAAHRFAASDTRSYFQALVAAGWSEAQSFEIVLAWTKRPPGLDFQQLLALVRAIKDEDE